MSRLTAHFNVSIDDPALIYAKFELIEMQRYPALKTPCGTRHRRTHDTKLRLKLNLAAQRLM